MPRRRVAGQPLRQWAFRVLRLLRDPGRGRSKRVPWGGRGGGETSAREKEERDPPKPPRRLLQAADLMEELSVPRPGRWGPWAKDHCDFLLDSIDAQLSQLQAQGPKAKMEEGHNQAVAAAAAASLVGITYTSGRADPGRCPGNKREDGSLDRSPSFQKEQATRSPVPLLALEGTSRDERKSDSICTEDFAATFYECLVDPLLNSSESAFGLATGSPGHILGRSGENLTPSQRFQDFQAAQDPHSVDPGRDKSAACSPTDVSERIEALPKEPLSLCPPRKIYSPESAGEKISQLSWESSVETSRATGAPPDIPRGGRSLQHEPVTWGGKAMDVTWISRNGGFGCNSVKDSLAWIPDPHDSASSPLLVEDLGPPKPLKTVDAAAAAGPGTTRAHVPLRDPQRSLHLRDGGCEEEAARLPASGSWRSCPFWKSAPRPTTDPGGMEAPWGDCWSRTIAERMEQAKTSALHQQAAGFQKEMEDLQKNIEERDAELLQKQLAMEQQAMEMKEMAEKMVQSALLQEKKKWEVDTRAALQMQREVLQEKEERMRNDLQEALQEERKTNLALQDKTAHLQARIQDLETQALLFQGKKREEMEEVRAQLQKEKVQALRCLQDDLEREKKQEMDQLRAKLQQSGENLRHLRSEGSQSSAEQALGRSLATEVTLVCQQLQDLLPWKAGSVLSTSQMLDGRPAAVSSGFALQALQEVCREMQLYLQDLRHKMEMQKHEILQVQREKEHMKDMLALQQGWWKEDLVLSRCLRGLLRSRGPWKATLAHQAAREFEEDLDAELKK